MISSKELFNNIHNVKSMRMELDERKYMKQNYTNNKCYNGINEVNKYGNIPAPYSYQDMDDVCSIPDLTAYVVKCNGSKNVLSEKRSCKDAYLNQVINRIPQQVPIEDNKLPTIIDRKSNFYIKKAPSTIPISRDVPQNEIEQDLGSPINSPWYHITVALSSLLEKGYLPKENYQTVEQLKEIIRHEDSLNSSSSNNDSQQCHSFRSANDDSFNSSVQIEDKCSPSSIQRNGQPVVNSLKLQRQNQQNMDQTVKDRIRFKTELCENLKIKSYCAFQDKCHFAHDLCELRPRSTDPKYKTAMCKSFHGANGVCNYGMRCDYIHNEGPEELSRLKRYNQLFERLKNYFVDAKQPPSYRELEELAVEKAVMNRGHVLSSIR